MAPGCPVGLVGTGDVGVAVYVCFRGGVLLYQCTISYKWKDIT